MSEQTAQEPTMEEILASIRRIISEDDAPVSTDGAAENPEPEPEPEAVMEAADPEPAPRPEPELAPEAVAVPAEEVEDEDVLELNEPVAPPAPAAAQTIGDLDVFTPAPEPAAAPQPSAPVLREEPLVSPPTAMAAASAFQTLAQRVAMPPSSQTLDDVVREMLRPLLKEWLDQNLAAIVQAKVEQEVERVARGRVG